MIKLPRNKSMPKRNGAQPPPRDPGPRGGPYGPNNAAHHTQNNGPTKGPRGNKGGPKGNRGNFFGGLGNYQGVNLHSVNQLVNGLIHQQMNALNSQQQDLTQQYNNGLSVAQANYDRGQGDLRYVHGETQDYLNNLQGQQAAAQAALQSQLQGTYTGAASGVNDELARLGIQGGASTGMIAADQANAQNLASISGTNNAAGMNFLQGMNEGQYSSNQGNNLNAFNSAASQLQQERIDGLRDIQTAIRDVKGSRTDLFNQLMNQLQQSGWGQFMDQQQLNLALAQLGNKDRHAFMNMLHGNRHGNKHGNKNGNKNKKH